MSDKKHKQKHEFKEEQEAECVCECEHAEDKSGEALRELEDKLKACEDKYIRAHADFENIKKRYEKEKYQAIDYACEQFARDLLQVIDALEIAYASGEDSNDEVFKKIKEGVGLTLEQLRRVFEKHGIKETNSEKFDPNVHNAVLQVENEGKESGDIAQVFQKGYTIKNRVLRAAMVSIVK
jgi:molecular chaperone GrpE